MLGDGATATYRVDELLPVYLPRRAALQRLLDDHLAGGTAVTWEDDEVRACFRCPECAIQVRATDDLLLVAGMRVSQRARLIDAGITTLSALAQHDGPVPELSARTVASLTAQARLQIAPRVDGKPPYEVADPQPLNLLPDPDKGDLFFDFEGDPLWTADGREWGLEYMWGVLDVGGAFRPLWAHDRASERQALVDFLAMVRKRRKRYPKMHIYHYAAYEKTALLRLAGRYGVGEDEVDDLLRSGVLVDLFPLVRKSIRVGTENYSLKSLEPLYMGSELRSGDVTTAAESITMYARYCELRADGRAAPAEAANVLKEIEDYNRYDCRSTHKLRDWLIKIAIESSVPPLGPQPVADGTAVEDTDELARTLMAFAGDGVEERSPEQTAVAMFAAARGYHRREDKPFWWAHFDRLNNPVDEWGDTSDVFLADDVGEVVKDWHLPSSRARKQQRWVKLTGTLAAGGLDSNVFALYNPPSPAGLTDNPDRRAAGNAEIIDVDDPNVPTEVTICEREPKDGGTFRAAAVRADAGQALPDRQAARFHRRRGRRRRGRSAQPARQRDRRHPAAPHPAHPQRRTAAAHAATPPRTSRPRCSTSTRPTLRCTARPAPARPTRRPGSSPGWSNEHRLAGRRRGAVTCGGGEPVPRSDRGRCRPGADRQEGLAAGRRVAGRRQGRLRRVRRHERRLRDRRHRMGFRQRHPGRRGQPRPAGDRRGRPVLPGQHHRGGPCGPQPAAARRPAAAAAGQPGHHPEPVDASALGWLIDGHRTLPERARLLPRPLVPDAPRAVRARLAAVLRGPAALATRAAPRRARSTAYRAGRARAAGRPRRQLDQQPGGGGGIVAADAATARRRMDRRGRHPRRSPRPTCSWSRRTTRRCCCCRTHFDAAGLPDVAVGTVDKFQGRQAPVVFVSMTASSIDDVPRGISFLLNRNRLNVAVSRAKYLSIIVRSEALTEYLPATPDRLVELGAFLSLAASL